MAPVDQGFDSAQSRAWVATFGIIGVAGSQVLVLALEWVEHIWFPDLENDDSNVAGVFAGMFALVSLVTLVAC